MVGGPIPMQVIRVVRGAGGLEALLREHLAQPSLRPHIPRFRG